MDLKRITVVVITYNQQKLIGRALDSILIQKEWGLHSIVISDDKSTDNNWNVIQKYKEDYPSFIDPHRNEMNKGIYGNLQLALSYVQDTDLIIMCSGDDALCDGYLKALQNYIVSKNIDTHRALSIFSDWKSINPKDEESIVFNSAIQGSISPFSVKLRGYVYNRSVVSTKAVYDQFKPLPLERGLAISEGIFDLMLEQYSEECFYMPFVGSIYYSGIGISTKLQSAKYIEEEAGKWNYYTHYFDLSKKDKYYCLHNFHFSMFLVHSRFADYFKTLHYYIKSWLRGYSSFNDFAFLFARLTYCLVTNKKVE